MKKQILIVISALVMLTICQTLNATAAKNSSVLNHPDVNVVKPINKAKFFFDLGVGFLNDPNNSSILYVIFGDSNGTALTIVKVYISGVLQSGTGVTVSGTYSHVSAGVYRVTGTITRADNSTFSCNGVYDMN